jgi:hypothetical protein
MKGGFGIFIVNLQSDAISQMMLDKRNILGMESMLHFTGAWLRGNDTMGWMGTLKCIS